MSLYGTMRDYEGLAGLITVAGQLLTADRVVSLLFAYCVCGFLCLGGLSFFSHEDLYTKNRSRLRSIYRSFMRLQSSRIAYVSSQSTE